MKLTMLRGLPASGKSTLARSEVVKTGNSGRINRDDLRAMLFNSAWSGKREQAVIDCEKSIAKALFANGMNPIIDDTNLSDRHRDMWRNVAKESEQAFELRDLGIGVDECRFRDNFRVGRVGRAVIDRMALYNGLIDWGDKPIVLVDIDGTLADGRHREHHVQGEHKNWTEYYAMLADDSPIDLVVRWVRELKKDHTVCIVSGRPDTYQRGTMAWLSREDVNIEYDWIFMRAGGDKRPDTMVKDDILKHIPRDKIAFAIDDRPCVIREVWRANNVRVFPVRGACEEF